MKHTSALLLSVLAFSLLCGCTVGGALVGHRTDRRNSRATMADWVSVRSMEHGRPVDVFLVNGDTLRGYFEGVRHIPLEKYEVIYTAWRSGQDTSSLPALNQPLVLTLRSGKQLVRSFRGFEPDALGAARVSVQPPKAYPLSELVRIQTVGKDSFDLERLRRRMSTREFPMATVLMLSEGESSREVPLGSVRQVYQPAAHTHRWIEGMVAGFLLDAAFGGLVYIAVSSAMNNMENDLDNAFH